MIRTILYSISAVALIISILLSSGCAPSSQLDPSTTYFPELQNRFPPTDGALSVQKLTAETANAARKSKEQAEIFIIVHPAYSHFFRDLEKDSTHAAKFRLEKKQFESEAIMIGSHAASGAVMVLVIPGDYFEESKAPRSYVSYLNTVTAGGRSIDDVLSAASAAARCLPKTW